MGQRADRAEEAFAALAAHFVDESSEDRAYTTFHNLTFRSFKNQKDNQNVNEAEVVRIFYS